MKHIEAPAHTVLLSGFTVGILAFFNSPAGQKQFWVVLALTSFYLVWGFTYHHLKRDVNNRLLMEYLAIAAIVSVVNIIIFGK